MSHTVIAISKLWATVLASILASGVIGGVVTAKTMYDGLAEEGKARAVLEEQIKPLKDANLDHRMTMLEAQVQISVTNTNDIKASQIRQDEKIDKILEHQTGKK
jgi:hypothetical protein